MSANSGSIGSSRNGTLAGELSKNNQETVVGQKRFREPPPLHRSLTDSLITYTPPSIGEAPGSTFYIRKNGQIDYLVLLKVRLRNVMWVMPFLSHSQERLEWEYNASPWLDYHLYFYCFRRLCTKSPCEKMFAR